MNFTLINHSIANTSFKLCIRRAVTGPSNNSRICSCHFIDGNKAKGPSIFSWNKEKLFKFESPEKS